MDSIRAHAQWLCKTLILFKMKKLRFLFAILFGLSAISCSDDEVFKTSGDEDDDPIIIGPPSPPPGQDPIPLDSLNG